MKQRALPPYLGPYRAPVLLTGTMPEYTLCVERTEASLLSLWTVTDELLSELFCQVSEKINI